MEATVCPFDERTIAQGIVVCRAFCAAMNKVPYIVALVEGRDAERDAWRQVSIDYLTARAKGVKSIHEQVKLQED